LLVDWNDLPKKTKWTKIKNWGTFEEKPRNQGDNTDSTDTNRDALLEHDRSFQIYNKAWFVAIRSATTSQLVHD
jgi:hypothetical protein